MTKYHFEKVETWDAMTERHKQERINQVMFFSKSHTQTEAAEILGVTHRHLNNFVQRKGLNWRHKYKRAKKNCTLMTEDEWIDESQKLVNKVYSEVKNKDSLGYTYIYENFDLVKLQLFTAGVRLADTLNGIFDE